MASQSYRERMKAQRAAASAQRKAEQAEWRRRLRAILRSQEAGARQSRPGSDPEEISSRSTPTPTS